MKRIKRNNQTPSRHARRDDALDGADNVIVEPTTGAPSQVHVRRGWAVYVYHAATWYVVDHYDARDVLVTDTEAKRRVARCAARANLRPPVGKVKGVCPGEAEEPS